MTTYIKGTFPVRFRRDGKDGVNVWLKYATVLDLKDSNTGKSYPSIGNIRDTPDADCKYIGIGKGVGDEPIQGQYYEWKKYVGDDGTSFTPKGRAIAHYTTLTAYNSASKSVGLYLVDDTAGALLKYWNGSASENRSVEDGDGYTTADKHLWVKDGAKWNDLGEIQGPKGDPAYIDTIYLKGTSHNTAGTPTAIVNRVKNNASSTYGASDRGLHAYKINRTTLAVTKIGAYDTHINTATADTLATEINKLDTTVFLAIVSFDACGFTTNFVTAIKQFGGNDIADLKAKSQAFCFLGYKGMAPGTALQVLNVGDAKIAEISSIVSNGVCQGSGQGGNSVLSVTNYYLAGSDSSNAPTWREWVTDPGKSGFSASKPYLWGYEETTFSLSSPKETEKRVIGVWSKDGKGIKSITEYYLATSASSGVTKDREVWDWTTTVQTITPTKKYLWNYELITFNDSSKTESTPCIIGVYGDKGDPGKDAVSYKLSSSISAIPLDNDAYPTVSSFTLTAYKFVGNASATFDDSYQLVAIISYSGNPTPISVNTKLGSSSKMTVYLRAGGLSSGSLLKDIKSVTCYLYHGSITLDSFAILPIKAGAAGVSYFPNMRGLWQPNANPPYSWKDGSRDMVVYNKGGGTAYLFAVKTAGATNITSKPMSEAGTVNSDWVQADAPFSMLFGNFVYTDNASVGGFVFSEEQMRSTSTTDGKSPEPKGSNCNILINGNTGFFRARHAEIKGIINATKGVFDNCVINDTCTITRIDAVKGTIGGFTIGDSSIYTKENAYSGGSGVNSFSESKFFLHASGYSSAFLGFSATNKWAGIGLNTLPSTSATTALARFEDTVTNTFDWTKIGVYLNVAGAKTYDDIGKGNCAIYAEQGVYTGFRIGTKLTTKSVTLTKMDNVIICYNTTDITITLPSDCEKGQVMMVRPAGTKGVTIQVTSGTILRNNDTMGNGVTSFTCGGKWMHFFIYDKYNNTWIMGYTN